MSAATQVSIAEYLNSSYEPDCEYIDGVLEDRNVGKRKHSRLQGKIFTWLLLRISELGYEVLIEQRVRITASRVRIPDLCVVPASDADEVLEFPPTIWIEILSPDDRWSRVQRKLNDLLSFGVATIWIIDPYEEEAWLATPAGGVSRVEVLRCENLGLELPVADMLR